MKVRKIILAALMIPMFVSSGISVKADEKEDSCSECKGNWKRWTCGDYWREFNEGKQSWRRWWWDNTTEVELLDEPIALDEKIKIGEIENLEVESDFGEVILKVGKGDELEVILRHNIESEYAPELEINQDDEIIEIKNKANLPKGFRYSEDIIVELEIKLPKEYNKTINIDASAGSVKNEGSLNLEALKVDLAAGSIDFEKLDIKETDILCKAGSIKVDGLTSKEVDIKLISGKSYVIMDEVEGDLDFEVTSGTLKVEIPKESDVSIDVDAFYYSREIAKDVTIIKDDNGSFKGKLGNGNHDMNLSLISGKLTLEVE